MGRNREIDKLFSWKSALKGTVTELAVRNEASPLLQGPRYAKAFEPPGMQLQYVRFTQFVSATPHAH